MGRSLGDTAGLGRVELTKKGVLLNIFTKVLIGIGEEAGVPLLFDFLAFSVIVFTKVSEDAQANN